MSSTVRAPTCGYLTEIHRTETLGRLAGRATAEEVESFLTGADIDDEAALEAANNLKSVKSKLGIALKMRADGLIDDEAVESDDEATQPKKSKGKGKGKGKAKAKETVPESDDEVPEPKKSTKSKGKGKGKEKEVPEANMAESSANAVKRKPKPRQKGLHLAPQASSSTVRKPKATDDAMIVDAQPNPPVPASDAMAVDTDSTPPVPASAQASSSTVPVSGNSTELKSTDDVMAVDPEPSPPPSPASDSGNKDLERELTPGSDRCAVGLDGRLKDASEIDFNFDPDDENFLDTALAPHPTQHNDAQGEMSQLTPLPAGYETDVDMEAGPSNKRERQV